MRILDWELTALQARYGRSDTDLKAAVTNNFQTKMFNPQKAPLIYVGNQRIRPGGAPSPCSASTTPMSATPRPACSDQS
jgi:hypothetical protein